MPPANQPVFLDEDRWDMLLDSVVNDWCTPILGPEVSAGALKRRAQIAQQLCRETPGFPLSGEEDLAQVSQWMSVSVRNPLVWRNRVVEAFRAVEKPPAPPPEDKSHEILAGLKLSSYATTNFDGRMAGALDRRPARVRKELCPWFASDVNPFPLDDCWLRKPDFEPSPAEPVVFHLFGNLDKPVSMVLSYDDHLDFLSRVDGGFEVPGKAETKDRSILPNKLLAKLRSNYLLFLGYRVNDFDFHILMRSLKSVLASNQSQINPLIAVQIEDPGDPCEARITQQAEWLRDYVRLLEPSKADDAVSKRIASLNGYLNEMNKAAERRKQRLDRLREYLKTLCQRHKLEVIFGTCAEFIEELGKRYEEHVRPHVVAPAGAGK
jgi:hypothetical protein